MTERPPISLYVLAPYIKDIDETSLEATVHLPVAADARLHNENFIKKIEQNDTAKREVIYIIPTHSNTEGEEVSIKELVKKEFDNQSWHDEVEEAMKESGLIQDKGEWIDERISNASYRSSHDDDFTVRIDNLPEGYGRDALKSVLLDEGCNYFSRVVVPSDEQHNFKRFGFIKFRRLRYALKFIEDYGKIMVDGMVLNVALVV